jgi:hypothetical protein
MSDKPQLGVIEKDSRQGDFSTVLARQRLNELRRLVRYRRDNGLAVGNVWLWLEVITDLAMAKRSLRSVAEYDESRVHDPDYHAEFLSEFFEEGSPARERLRREVVGLFWRLDLGELVESIGDDWGIWPLRHHEKSTELMPAWLVGSLLGVTSVEREERELRSIDAVDNDASDRRRKANRQREAKRRREAGATPQTLSKSRTEPWRDAGVSRATWYRRKVEPT